MKLLAFSDIHNDYKALERLVEIEADYYFAVGDMASWSRGLDPCGEVLKRRAEKVYMLPGNHESVELIRTFCARFGFHHFHEQQMQVGRYYVAGLGYSNPTPFNTPGEYTEAQIEQRLERFTGLKPLVLICQCPPYGTPLDRVRQDVHAGSTAVRDFIDRNQPEYFLCGHIHEAAGVTAEIGKTRGTNVGKQGFLLELDEA